MNIDPLKRIEKSKKVAPKKKAQQADEPDPILFRRMMAAQNTAAIERVPENNADPDDLVQLHQKFVATVNHEINNPLFIVRGMAECIREDDLQGVKKRIVEDSDSISDSIKEFNQRDILTVGDECLNAPLTEISFREDLVGCYLHKVIGSLTAKLNRYLDSIENALEMEKTPLTQNTPQFNRMQGALTTIRKNAERLRGVIAKLQELLPDDIETTTYVEELQMIKIQKDEENGQA